jgi:hypothetical protein
MYISVYLPLLLALFAPGLAPVSRRCSPRLGTWLLIVGAITVATSASIALGLLAFAGLATVPSLAAWAHWSPLVVANSEFVPLPVGLLAGACLLACVAATLRRTARCARSLSEIHRTAARLDSELVVVEDAEPVAYALPGAGGHIVVSTAMLRGLTSVQRRALLAHERAHLTHRHHRFIATLRITTTLNPLLLPLRAALAYTLERWADEAAATAIGDRRQTAQAIGRAALISNSHSTPNELVLAATAGPMPRRVAALLAEPAPSGTRASRRWFTAVAVAASLNCFAMIAAATVDATTDLQDNLELASCVPHLTHVAGHPGGSVSSRHE